MVGTIAASWWNWPAATPALRCSRRETVGTTDGTVTRSCRAEGTRLHVALVLSDERDHAHVPQIHFSCYLSQDHRARGGEPWQGALQIAERPKLAALSSKESTVPIFRASSRTSASVLLAACLRRRTAAKRIHFGGGRNARYTTTQRETLRYLYVRVTHFQTSCWS